MKGIRSKIQRGKEIFPEEIFIDSSNLPNFDQNQFEGRIEKPIPKASLIFLAGLFFILGVIYTARAWGLQGEQGSVFLAKSENNRLHHTTIFAERGAIADRHGQLLAWNVPNTESADFAERRYNPSPAFSHLIGYVKYPSKDSKGFYYNELYEGKDGLEGFFNESLSGSNGLKISETDALGEIQSENIITPPKPGLSLTLSIDAEIQAKLYEVIQAIARNADFQGGAAGLLDIKTGEMLAMASYPGYNPNILTDGSDAKTIANLFKRNDTPFLDRFVNGLYTPGSTVKPFLALGVLDQKIIDPKKQIESTGSISLPNIYDSSLQTVFADWRAHGWTDMRRAIAVSSDVYFYEVIGGYKDQPGLGITNLEKYMRMFGFGDLLSAGYLSGKKGVIPNPEWKKQNFDGEDWRIGDTYHTAIGQYGLQVTPVQMLAGVATIANEGIVPNLTILKDGNQGNNEFHKVPLPESYFKIVKEGMRMTVTEGTATSLESTGLRIAGKTGSAELGTTKKFTNSWFVGFFPYEAPRYAFVFLMDRGPSTNTVGASTAAREFLTWLSNQPGFAN